MKIQVKFPDAQEFWVCLLNYLSQFPVPTIALQKLHHEVQVTLVRISDEKKRVTFVRSINHGPSN